MTHSTEIDAVVVALVARRVWLGLSQREVSRRSGLSVGGLCELERGDHSPTLRNLRAWAKALDCEPVLACVTSPGSSEAVL